MDGKKRKRTGKNRRKQDRSRRYAVILPYLVVLVISFFAFGERLWNVTEIKMAIREKEWELAEAQERKAKLEEEKDIVTDIGALHIKMRQLGYIYPGETVYLDAD